MVNEIKDGISIKLNQVFGDDYRIYSKKVKQGLKEPCFFIAVLNPSQKQLIGNRYFREHFFDIHYFPSAKDDDDELDEMGSNLFTDLEYITLVNGDLIRGTKMSYEKIDGVLHFFVNYNAFVRKDIDSEDGMEDITIKSGVKQ
jgi:hypothetical protein